ncbi:MAG: hypothetical protein CVU06_06960 [Bacteroidetes bacterium HGW-Bacteroidetes-22]|nr:MAG: hypothetical protein CVU06_06960 [Bacteroidetes bacterium HGW-Bacteroidetes-22]
MCLNAALEKKAKRLAVLNVKDVSSLSDYFVIGSGSSDRQVQAIAAAIEEVLKKEGKSDRVSLLMACCRKLSLNS